MAWTKSTVTVKGTEMVAELLGGGNLTITKAEISEVTIPSAKLAFLTAISSPIDVPVSIAYIKKSDNNVRVCIQIQNTGLTSDKNMRQIGIYAKTETMAETLFAVVQDETGDTIPSAESYPLFLLEFNDKISVANTDNITAVIDPASIIVTQEVLSNTLDDYTGKSEFEAHTLNSVNHITEAEREAWNAKAETNTATTIADGLMSAADKEKLDGVAEELNDHIADQVKHITEEERTAWNAVNYSNPNLLINPDFRINQRGLTKYTGTASGYTVDRWWKGFQYLPTSGDVVVTTSESGSITITNSTDKTITFAQKVENSRFLYGKTVTASARIDGVTYMATGTVLTTGKGTILLGESSSKFNFTVYQDCSIERFDFEFHIASGVTVTIDWAKLEIGGIATLFCPPDPATELAKCQRYYQIRSTNDIDPVDLRPSMRATPTDIKKVTGGYAYVAEL